MGFHWISPPRSQVPHFHILSYSALPPLPGVSPPLPTAFCLTRVFLLALKYWALVTNPLNVSFPILRRNSKMTHFRWRGLNDSAGEAWAESRCKEMKCGPFTLSVLLLSKLFPKCWASRKASSTSCAWKWQLFPRILAVCSWPSPWLLLLSVLHCRACVEVVFSPAAWLRAGTLIHFCHFWAQHGHNMGHWNHSVNLCWHKMKYRDKPKQQKPQALNKKCQEQILQVLILNSNSAVGSLTLRPCAPPLHTPCVTLQHCHWRGAPLRCLLKWTADSTHF